MLRKIWTVPKSSYWMLKMGEMAPTWDHLTHEQLIKCRDFFNTLRVSGGGMFRCDWTYDYLHGFFSTLILVLLTSDYKQWKNVWESLMCQQWLTWLTHERENSYSKKTAYLKAYAKCLHVWVISDNCTRYVMPFVLDCYLVKFFFFSLSVLPVWWNKVVYKLSNIVGKWRRGTAC